MSVSADRAVSMTIGDGARARAQLAADVEAVLLRQHDVEDDEVGRKAAGARQPLFAVGRRLHLVTFELEIVTQTEQHLRLVLDHQNPLHDRSLRGCARAGRSSRPRGDGEVQSERAAVRELAVNAHEAAVAAHRVVDDGEPEAAALRSAAQAAVNTIELAEDPLLLAPRDADAAVAHADADVTARARPTLTSMSRDSPEYFIALASRFSIACSTASSSIVHARQRPDRPGCAR